ncbi:MAG: DHA2 family efflux MFS transporter permease subunit [Acidimicrobiales bacterium]
MRDSQQTAPSNTPARRSRDGMVLAIACLAQFMVVLDVSIVNVALPSIGRDLHYSASGLQWVVNAYVLTFAGFLLLGGRAADIFGRRRVYMAGLWLFSAASLAGGFAQDSTWLTIARAAQGVGGAILSPATLTIIVTTFSGKHLPRALGIWSAVAGAGGAAGSILGGVLTAELSWRWVLFVNIPVGVVATVAALGYLTEAKGHNPDGTRPKLDVIGAIAVTGGLSALVYAIVGTSTHPWASGQTLAFLAVALVALVGFVVYEARFPTNPLVPLRLFRSRSVWGANLVMFLVGAAFFAMWYFLSLYLQDVLGYGALRAGMAFLPMAVTIIVGAQTSSRLLPRIGARPLLLAGTVAATAGFFWLSEITVHGAYWAHVFGPGCIISLALGLLFTPLASAATAGVARHEAGLASGVLNTSRQVGGSLGLAVLATIATDRTNSLLHANASAGASGVSRAVLAATDSGFVRAFEVAALVCAAGFVAAFVVPKLRSPAPAAERPPGDLRSFSTSS